METKAINTKLKGHARVDVADVLRGLASDGNHHPALYRTF